MTFPSDRLLFYACSATVLLYFSASLAQDPTGPPHDHMMVCYISTWANYRLYPANFFPSDIDPNQCSHLIYAFVGLDNKTNRVISLDPWADLDPPDGRGFFRQMTGFKVDYPHLKVLLAVGGFDEGSKKYSVMASSKATRTIFIASALEMILEYGFDGFDLDWEYPGKRGGAPEDKQNFVLLAKELRESLNPRGLLLSSAFGAGIPTMEVAYDFAGLAPYLDMFNVMAYDYHGAFDNVTGANSPFYAQNDSWSVTDTLQYMKDEGAPMHKVVLGLPLYGQTFIMDEPQNDGTLELGVPCDNVGFPGGFTIQPGFMGNQEICTLRADSRWTRFWDNVTGTPFYLNNEKLISYDDEESIALKVEHAVELGLGGLMIWSMDTEEFRGDCAGVMYPMMRHINNLIRDLTSTTVDPDATTTVTTTTTDSSIDWTKPPHPLHMVCYVGTWAHWRNLTAKYTTQDIDGRLCTHLLYAFAGVDNFTFVTKSLDPYLDLDKDEKGLENFRNMTSLKVQHPHLKVLLAIGGASESETSSKYSELAASPPKRRVFTRSLVSFLRKYGFDGVDMDWEYPGMNGGAPEDKENFVTLIKELRAELNKYNLLLTAAFGAGVETLEVAYDIPALAPHMDMMLIMSYDYHGAWNNKTGANAPLYWQDDQYSVADTLDYLKAAGAPMEKVIVGLPLYGHTFVMTDPENVTSLGEPCENEGFAGAFIAQKGFMGYQEICEVLMKPEWTEYWDKNTSTPFMINQEKVVSYDNEASLREKVDYVVRYGVGGLMLWSLDTDEFRGVVADVKYPLTKQINKAVRDTLDSMENDTTTVWPGTTSDPGEVTTTAATSTTEETAWTRPPHDLSVLCYVNSTAHYRNKPATFTTADIDAAMCTHLVYTFAGLAKNWTMVSLNPSLDMNANENGLGNYIATTRLRETNPHLLVLLAVGGATEDSAMYSDMAADAVKRSTFVTSVVRMLLKYEFNGLDLNWQYPGERGGKPEDKQNFVLLIQELRTAFDRYDFILSTAIHGSPSVMATAYDFLEIRDHVDLFNIMTYEYSSHEDEATGANSPLHAMGNSSSSYTVEDTMDYLVENGVPMAKVNLGIAFYGITFVVDDEDEEEPPTSPWGLPVVSSFSGVYIYNTTGYMAYNEICLELTDRYWNSFWDNLTETPYMVNRDKLISFDNVPSVELKVNLGLKYNIGGFAAWSVDSDDHLDDCSAGRYPLLKTISTTISRSTSTLATDQTTTSRQTTTTTRPTTTTTRPSTTSTQTTNPTTTPSSARRNTVAWLGLFAAITATFFIV